MDTFWPTIAFISVDLPAFGAPISVAKPAEYLYLLMSSCDHLFLLS